MTVRGIDLELVRRFREPGAASGRRPHRPATLFFPMLRIERIALDEARGSIPSMAEVFEKKVGRSLASYLAQFA